MKRLVLSMDFGAPGATYVSDMVCLSEAGRAQVYAFLTSLRVEIYKVVEDDATSRFDNYSLHAILMLVRNFDMELVCKMDDQDSTQIS